MDYGGVVHNFISVIILLLSFIALLIHGRLGLRAAVRHHGSKSVTVHGLGLLRPRPNAGPFSDGSAAEGGVRTNAALRK